MAHRDPGGRVDEAAALMLEALFTQSPVGLHLIDTDLRVLRVNTATPGMRNLSMDDLRGRPVREVYRLVDDDVEALLRDVLDTGVPVRQRIVRAHVEGDAQARNFEVSALRLEGSQRSVLGVAVTAVDVTERERGLARTRMLDVVRERVGRTLEPALIGEELAAAVVPAFADVAVVDVVDAVLRGDDPPLVPPPTGTHVIRTAFHGAGRRPPPARSVGDVRHLAGQTPFTQALADLRPRVVRLQPDTSWLAADPALAEAIRSSGAHSLLVVPLTLRDTALGIVSLYRTEHSPAFDEDDRAFAVELATHTALCIDNARRYTREHTIAATVQRQLLPRRPEAHAWLETAYLSVTGADPGAWYDTTTLSGARTSIVVGEVSGRGVHAAAIMGQLRTAVRSLSVFDLTPDELLARLHDTAGRLAAERAHLPLSDPLRQEALTADCVYAVHDPLTDTCTMAAAGRLAPLVVRPDGTVSLPGAPAGPRLGSSEGAPFAAVEIDVPAGSVLVFASDPLLTSYLAESPGPLATVSAYADRPLQDLGDALVYSLPADLGVSDAAVIVARTRAFPADRCAAWPLDPEPASVADARRRTRRQLAAWNVDDETAYNIQLIVSELVTNAIRYGRSPLELRLIHDRTLTCEMRDAGSAAPHLRHAATADEGGRGLFIIAQLAQAWGTRFGTRGKTIWAEQALSGTTESEGSV
ncbi:SpoIIE family protein phosphatase [Streptomyces sp. NPDC057301]|uniref:SpoIIE family protein phosphatase n=1 Tax=Streptomyces sp. NPDC057301 TaxID=3346093 RepID=UPI00364509C3